MSTYPRILQRFRNLPGQYGLMTLHAKSADRLDVELGREFVGINRADAQEVIRVLTAWLAGVPETTVVRTHGAESTVVVVDKGPGAPHVIVRDDERRPSQTAGHFEVVSTQYEQHRPQEGDPVPHAPQAARAGRPLH
ncbi:hypothetical protein EON77_06485, partial [bacterium]